jgi:hypothetical protein
MATTNQNNLALRELIERSGLTQVEALAKFNEGLGPGAYSIDAWKSYLAAPGSTRQRAFSDKLLAHAQKVFAAPKKGTKKSSP